MGENLHAALSRLQNVSEQLGFGSDVVAQLKYPRETLAASLPVRMDDGALRHLKAWRCRYNDLLGPTKGGIRFHEGVSHDEVMTLAFWMTIKCALTHLPFGGAKGGVQVDASELSPAEKERTMRAYVRAMQRLIGPDQDVPAPDMYTDDRAMAWLADEFGVLKGEHAWDVVTGKPLVLGGLDGRREATGQGCAIVIRALQERLDLDPKNTRVAVQGFGSAGRFLAQALAQDGYKVVAVADSSATRVAEDGLAIDDLIEHKEETGSVKDGPGEGNTSNKESDAILETDCDLLVPAALGGQIDKDKAERLSARVVVELANGPTKPEADDVLEERNITVIPDVLANAGGVAASYLEWMQNRQRSSLERDAVETALEERLTAAAERVYAMADEQEMTLREAAYGVALKRLCQAVAAKGGSDFFVQA